MSFSIRPRTRGPRKNRRGLGRIALTALALSPLSLMACSSAESNPTATTHEKLGAPHEELYGLGSIATPWVEGAVPVCFSNVGQNQALEAQIPGILQSSWTAAANVVFYGFNSCADEQTPPPGIIPALNFPRVQVVFASQSGGFTSTLGQASSTVTLISDDATPNQAHFQYEVIHEFGHVLGFAHEMKRPDNWVNGVAVQCGVAASNSDYAQYAMEGGGLYLTPTYDSYSIMNYCDPAGNQTDWLSVGDVNGVRSAYGVPRGFNGNRPQDGRIAVLSRAPGTIEVFWITANGAVNDSYWYDGGTSWSTYQLVPPGSASTTGRISAVSRAPDKMELWYVGADGSVQDKYWTDGVGWNGFPLAPRGSAWTRGGGITAVGRSPDKMEVWYVGADGSVQDHYWSDGAGVWQSFPLAGPGSASVSGGITAVTRAADAMEVWYVGSDGSVQDKFWYDGASAWNGFPLAPAGSASLTGGITAVSRIPSSMEVFYVGPRGSVQDNYWYDAAGVWSGFQLEAPGSASVTGGLSVVSTVPTSLELFYIGGNGSVQEAAYSAIPGFGWTTSERAGAGSARTTDGIASVSRYADAMEFFYTGVDGSVQDQYVNDTVLPLVGWPGFALAGAGSAP